MFKKFLSIILAVSLMLTLAFAVNTAASGKWAIDLSGYEAGAQYSKLGNGYKTFVVEEDGKKSVLFAQSGTAYGESDHLTDRLLLPVSGGLPEDTKGIIAEATFKTSSTGHSIFLSPGYNKTPRYMVATGGKLRIDGTSANTDTGLTYAANTWIKTKLSINFVTGYYILEKTDVSTGAVTKYASTNENFKKTCDAATMAAFTSIDLWKDSSAGNVYVSDFSIESVSDAAAIAPSRILIRDDFDNNTDALTGWSGGGIVAETDRGKSAEIVCDVAERRINQTIKLTSDVKGLVSEFSVMLTGTGGTEFIYSASKNKDGWTSPAARLIQFASNGKIHAFNGALQLGSYKANTWYDVRIETNFVNDFARISISDGENESVYEIVNSSTYYDTVTDIVRVDFVSSAAMATPKSIYVDDINIFWLDEEEVSGLKNPKTYTLHNEFENFAEGNMQEDLIADVTCDATKSFKVAPVEDNFEVGIESVANSGRGKSFKASNLTGEKTYEFYKDFLAIQNGVIEFDMMLPEKDGVILIENQVSNKDNGNMSYVAPFRFKADGTITGGIGGEAIGSYEENKWYHVSLTSGTYEIDGASNTAILAQIYDSGELVCENTVRTDEDGVSRDSIRNVKISLAEGTNTVYVDNFRVYPSAGVQGIYPTPSRLLREKTIAPDGELIIPFSKVVDLTKSKFKVNGEEVSAVLLGGNVAKLNKTITTGEEYEIEYTATDLDGFTTKGYIGGIKALKGLITEDFTAATMDSPTASVKVTVNSVYLAKNVQLIVATYNESESRVIDIDITSAAAGTGEQTLTATANTEGAAKIKTFFWDGISLVPVSID